MRVLHVVDTLDPTAGGVPLIAYELAQALGRRGLSVRLATPHGRDRVDRLGVPGGSAEVVPFPDGSAEVQELVRGADVVHLHGVWDRCLLAAGRAARAAGVPYLICLHGMLDPWSLAQKRLKKRLALAVTHRRLVRGAARLHLGNADEQELIRPLGLPVPGVIVPNGVRPPAELPLPGTFRAAHPAVGDRPFVLFLSRLHHKKGTDLLADAFIRIAAAFPAVLLVAAGPDGGAQADLEGRLAAAGLADRAYLPGPLYGADKWAALTDAACFCLPSRQEGFSMAILEALAAGRPAVVTDTCHFPEVGEAGAGVVVRLDAKAVADGLAAVLADPSAADEMGRRGRSLTAQRYTWERVAEQLESVYRSLTATVPASNGR